MLRLVGGGGEDAVWQSLWQGEGVGLCLAALVPELVVRRLLAISQFLALVMRAVPSSADRPRPEPEAGPCELQDAEL